MRTGESPGVFGRFRRRVARRRIGALALRLRAQLARGRAFTCLVADDRTLRSLNRRFRGRDAATDVLSFPPAGPPRGELGDLAISVDRAASQARDYGHAIEDEIGILMLHGVLHLLGMDHSNDGGRMARAERRWRRRLGLPCGLIERGLS